LLYPQDGLSQPRAIGLGDPPSFFYEPVFSPDGKKILCTDKRMNARIVDLEAGTSIVVDTDTYDHPERTLDPTWSPDGRWVAYTKRLDNHLRALFLYDVAAATTHQVTDGLSDATSACFSRDGKYLYFAASTDFGLNAAWLDMTSIDRPTTRSLYLAVLSSEEPSPFLPESDEEGTDEKKKDEADAKKTEEKDATADAGSGAEAKDAPKEESAPKAIEPIRVDLEGLDQRILALPLPPGHYGELRAADGGALLYLDTPPEGGPSTLSRFDLAERKGEPSIAGIEAYALSGDGKKIVYAIDGTVGIVEATGKHTVGDGKLALDSLQIRVEPVAEWQEIFHEAWRIERDYFYDAAMHGLDWAATRALYEPFLAHVAHRSDLNYLLAEMIGEMVVGHNYVGGGDQPTSKSVAVGLLGADLALDSGHYKIVRIFDGENWNPELRAPLTGPGIDARVGDYILSIDGRPLVPREHLPAPQGPPTGPSCCN
jgi:tricorn protease